MTVNFKILGTQDGKELEVDARRFNTPDGVHTSLMVLTEPVRTFTPNFLPFLNSTFGNAMNQNVGFGGSPQLIFDGGSGGTEWTGTSGDPEWDFADAGKVTVDHALDGTVALFSKGSTTSSGAYSAITGKVDLDNYTPGTQSMDVQFQLGGVLVGNSLVLDSFIDTGEFGEQTFTIPMSSFNTGGALVDEFAITVNRSGGHNPHVSFDDFTLQETGTPAEFKAFPPKSKSDFHVKKVRFVLADALAGTVADGTMQGLSYDKILNVSALTNGIIIQVVIGGEVVISGNLKQLSDLIGIGADIVESTSDGTNTMLVLELDFASDVVLKRGQEETDYISITVNDDLRGLLIFTGVARGAYEL